ncbi:MAG: alpha/beta hydrolase [Tidjanibacter sp.]|nr:alpha/beta hydrolase [Tidjanibacter sp.]
MKFHSFGPKGAPTVMLIPGLGVTFELFTPLINLLQERFHIIAVEIDGFVIGEHTQFTSIGDQAAQVANHILSHHSGHIACAYGLSLGGKILSHTLERGDITIDHAILDAAPLLPLPRIIVGPLSHLQALNVWTCYHLTGFWRRVFRSHYFDTLLDECRKAYPWGGRRAVIDGYKAVYTTKLYSISGNDIHYWYGTKEAFVARAQARHLTALHPRAQVTIFPKMNHGELLIDHPEEVAKRITQLIYPTL